MRRQGINGSGVLMSGVRDEHDEVVIDASEDGLTRQEFADECDINVLLARYERTGVLNHFNAKSPAYLDVTDVPDLQEALAVMADASTAFMTLPAKVRREFDNDPLKFVEFAQDENNVSQMREWGLAAPAKPADAFFEPSPTPVAADPPITSPQGS